MLTMAAAPSHPHQHVASPQAGAWSPASQDGHQHPSAGMQPRKRLPSIWSGKRGLWHVAIMQQVQAASTATARRHSGGGRRGSRQTSAYAEPHVQQELVALSQQREMHPAAHCTFALQTKECLQLSTCSATACLISLSCAACSSPSFALPS